MSKTLTREQIVIAIREAGATEREWKALTHDSGPYDITELNVFTRNFVERIVALSSLRSPVSEERLSAMVDRFLSWPLPKTFAPDCFISFDRESSARNPHVWPIGTNLFTADEAREMLRHVLSISESAAPSNPPA